MMAIPESEEVGFKRIGLSASDNDASLPIKKRRFPVVSSPPSPSKDMSSSDISSFNPDGNLRKNEQPSPPKDVSSLHINDNLIKSECPSLSVTIVSSSSVVTSSGLSNKNQDCVSDENKEKSATDSCYVDMVQSDMGIPGVKFQEPRLGGQSGFHCSVECEGKSLITEKHPVHASLEVCGGLELSSTSLNSDLIDVKVEGGAEVSVGLKGHMDPKLVPEKSDFNFLKPNSLEPVLLDLSLNKQGSGTHCVKGNVGSDYDGSLQQSHRENWDLNTSMEFWEGYASDDPPVQLPVVQTNTIVTTHRCLTEMVKTDIPSGKLTPLDHGDHLHLSLSSSDLRHVMRQEQSPFAKLDFRKTNAFLSLRGRGIRFDDLNGALKVVKPEPFAEGSKLLLKSDEVNGLGLSDGAAVKRELDDQCSLEIPNALDVCSPMSIVRAKSDSVYQSKQEALKTLGGRLDLVAKAVLPEVDNSCPIAMPFVAEMSEAAGNPCSTDLITDAGISNHSELQTPTKGLGLSDDVVVKRELDGQCSLEIPNALDNFSPMNIVKAKSESVYESNQKALETLGVRLDLVAKEVFPEVDNSCPIAMPFVAEISEAAGNPSCSTDLITDVDMSNHSELQTPTKGHLNMKIHEGGYGCGGELVHSEMTDISEDPGSKDASSPIIKPIVMPVAAEILEETRNPSSSTDLIIDGDMSNHSELLTPTEGPLNRKVHQGGYVCGGELVNSEMMDVSQNPGSKDSCSSVIKPSIVENENQNILQQHPLEVMNDQCSSLQGGEESSVSDSEKISISADVLEEDPYSSEYESDGKQDVNEPMDALDNDIEEDYEDGEVREPILKTQVESLVCEKREVKLFYHGDCSNGLPSIDGSSLVSLKQEKKSEIHDVKREDNLHSVTSNQSSEQENLKELLVEENTTRVCLSKANKAIKATGTRQLFQCEKIDALEDQEISSEKASNEIEVPIVKVSQSDAENITTVDSVQNDDLALPNVKESLNNDDVTDDFTHDSRDSQIVNPYQASTSSSPGKTRSNLVRSVLTQTDREQIPDMAHEGEKLQPQGRDDPFSDVSQKFYVNRHQNLSPQTNFTRRRGRFTIRINSVQGEWDFNPTISPGIYNDQIPPYDARRRKYIPAVSDDDIDHNHYKIKPDGPFRIAGHRDRQVLDDEGPLFCHIPSRRRSPGRRGDGPPVRGVKMVHRMPRNISPSRCIREPGSELVGPRHGEKFMRTLDEETIDPIYAHPHPPFEVDRPPFMRDQWNFPIQRKNFPRVDSRSPGRSRGRSPGPWFPSKRKSDRFFGHPEMARRSPPGYRMRSPDQPPPIDGDMPIRRHGFPFLPLPSNDMRDMGFARDHDHMRSGIRGRNRTDRISFRNRRFEDMDPRDRIEGGEYFDGPVHPGQLNELAGDGNDDDDGRRYPDRHEHLHPFQPQCNNSDGENYHNDVDERPRPFRYCADDEPEFHERGKFREREFDRRLKNQPGNLPRRTGVIEEHEVEDYRHGRPLWNEHHGFEDISRMKRKRF